MEEKVRQQLDQALQEFTKDMTAKFAQMMMMQCPMSNNLAMKRPAHQLQAEVDDYTTHGYLKGEVKRYTSTTITQLSKKRCIHLKTMIHKCGKHNQDRSGPS